MALWPPLLLPPSLPPSRRRLLAAAVGLATWRRAGAACGVGPRRAGCALRGVEPSPGGDAGDRWVLHLAGRGICRPSFHTLNTRHMHRPAASNNTRRVHNLFPSVVLPLPLFLSAFLHSESHSGHFECGLVCEETLSSARRLLLPRPSAPNARFVWTGSRAACRCGCRLMELFHVIVTLRPPLLLPFHLVPGSVFRPASASFPSYSTMPFMSPNPSQLAGLPVPAQH
jgi:hypothetical protein